MTTHSLAKLPLVQLKRAVGLRERIETLTTELDRLLNAPFLSSSPKPIAAKKSGLSAAGRAKIAAAQRLRWSKHNAAKAATAKKSSTKKQRLSAAGSAKVSAAVKARWERFRAAKAKNGGK